MKPVFTTVCARCIELAATTSDLTGEGHHAGWAGPLSLELPCEDTMRQLQICDHCGGHFGMVTHRWWGNKFCKTACKDAYLRELALGRDTIRRLYGLVRGGWLQAPSPR